MGMDKIETKKCEECSSPFKRRYGCSQLNWDKQKYCSRLCAAKGQSKTMKGICFNTGKTHFKKGISGNPSTQFVKGQVSQNKGKPNPRFQGPNNPRWKGGITPENKKDRWSQEAKDFRNKIFKRDNYTCKQCGRKRKLGDRVILNVHHFKPFATHKKLRFVNSNVITLCKECHLKTNSHGKNL